MKPTLDSFSAEKTFALSELLPYDPRVKSGVRLLSGLKEYFLILQASEETIECIKRGEIDNFDPLVGETACQIRALKIADILLNMRFNKETDCKIKSAKEIIKKLIFNIKTLESCSKSLYDLFIIEKLEIVVNADFMFMTRSYILSKVKLLMPQNPNESLFDNLVTKPKLVRDISHVGVDYAERFVRKLRVDLSESSVSYIQELSKKLPQPHQLCVKLVSAQFSIRHIGLQCIPYYWTTQILMQHALIREIPIILLAEQRASDKDYQTIKKAIIYFEATPAGYRNIDYITPHLDKPAIIVCGTSNANSYELPNQMQWTQELKEHGITDLILAHAASHPQYPDKSKEAMLQNIEDSSYQYYKEKADVWGCSIKNPSRFFIIHIFCDKVSHFIQKQRPSSTLSTLEATESMLLEDMTS